MAIIYVTPSGKLEERSAIPSKEGVYVYLDEDECEIKIEGNEKSFSLKELSEGWNLVSPGRISVSELKKMCHSIQKVETWNPQTGEWVVLSDDDKLDPAKGYWIYTTAQCFGTKGNEGEEHVIKGSIYAPGWSVSEIKSNCYLTPVYSSLSPNTHIMLHEVSDMGGAVFSFTANVRLKPQAKCDELPFFILLLRCEKNGKIYGSQGIGSIFTGIIMNGKLLPVKEHTVGETWILTKEDPNIDGGSGYVIVYIQDKNGKPILYNKISDVRICSDACQKKNKNGKCLGNCISLKDGDVHWGSGNAYGVVSFSKSINKFWAEVEYNGKTYKSDEVWFYAGIGGKLVVVIDDSEEGRANVCA